MIRILFEKLNMLLHHSITLFLIRIIIGITFIYASYYKILEPVEFARSIYNYKILPISLINISAVIIPWLEMICGLCLIVGLFTRAQAFIIFVLLLIFSVAIMSVIYRGIDVECGCFKDANEKAVQQDKKTDPDELIFTDKVGWPLLTRDLLMAALVLFLIITPTKHVGLGSLFNYRYFD